MVRGITNDPSCKICNANESSNHIFKNCRRATSILYYININPQKISGNMSLIDWLDLNLKNDVASYHHYIHWNIIFAITLW